MIVPNRFAQKMSLQHLIPRVEWAKKIEVADRERGNIKKGIAVSAIVKSAAEQVCPEALYPPRLHASYNTPPCLVPLFIPFSRLFRKKKNKKSKGKKFGSEKYGFPLFLLLKSSRGRDLI